MACGPKLPSHEWHYNISKSNVKSDGVLFWRTLYVPLHNKRQTKQLKAVKVVDLRQKLKVPHAFLSVEKARLQILTYSM